MPVKIKRNQGQSYPVELSIYEYDVRYLSDRELADLYLALTDFYASPDNTTHKENRP